MKLTDVEDTCDEYGIRHSTDPTRCNPAGPCRPCPGCPRCSPPWEPCAMCGKPTPNPWPTLDAICPPCWANRGEAHDG